MFLLVKIKLLNEVKKKYNKNTKNEKLYIGKIVSGIKKSAKNFEDKIGPFLKKFTFKKKKNSMFVLLD